MSDVFVHRLRALTDAAKEQLATAFKTSNYQVSVHSAFDLLPAQRKAIESAVKETFAPEAQVQFETAPELVSGIELSNNGQKVAWSIADYLATLEKSAGELLHDKSQPTPSRTRSPIRAEAETKSEPTSEAKPGRS